MDCRFKVPLAIVLALALPGCVTLLPERTQMQSAGRYGELVALEERESAGQAELPSHRLYDLCYGYGKIKDYGKLFACADRLQRQVERGDREIVLASTRRSGAGSGGIATARSDGSAYPGILRSEALIDLGEYGRAKAEAAAAVSLCARVSSTFAGFERTDCHVASLGLLGLAAALDRDPATARKASADLQAYPLELFGIAVTSQARGLALARIRIALGEYREALEFLGDPGAPFRFLANVFTGAVGKSSDLFAHQEMPFHYARARCLLGTQRWNDARNVLDMLLDYPQIADNGEIYWMVLYDRGRLAERDGDRDRAIDLYRRAVEVFERQRSTLSTEASKIGFVGDKQAVYRHLVSALVARGDLATAFQYIERSKSRALVDMLAAKQDFAVARGDPEKVRRLLATAAQAEAEARLQDIAAKASAPRGAAQDATRLLREESPELASLVSVTTLAAPEVQALIPPDETLVEYFDAGEALFAFLLDNRSLSVVRLDGARLQEAVSRFRQELTQIGSARHEATARELHARLFAPLAGRLATRKVVIVAHGPLHYLPFNALHDGSTWLVNRHDLRFLPSASVLPFLRARTEPKAGEILALGNPDRGDPRYDLAFAQAEVAAITRGRPGSKALVRQEASESAFRDLAAGFRYVHFATHGEFNADAPLKSTLLLAKEPQGDGLLTVDKLYSLRLDADLVTLSACETGLGRIASGDDVVGLTRGFLYAGSRSIVASLWQVDDAATAHLMTRFYDRLGRMDKREALRQAQVETMARYPHPFFWAAFQLTGSAD